MALEGPVRSGHVGGAIHVAIVSPEPWRGRLQGRRPRVPRASRHAGRLGSVTRQTQTDHELAVVRALLVARGLEFIDLRLGTAGSEADVVATLASGVTMPIEVGRIMDAETHEREGRALHAQEELLREFCATYRANGDEPPGVIVCVEFAGGTGPAIRNRVVAAVRAFVAAGTRPTDWMDIRPLPSGVSRLEAKFSATGAKGFIVPSAGAFFPGLRLLVERKQKKAYASKGKATLLAVVPVIQPWMRGPWLEQAVDELRARTGNSAAPFQEIVGLDEETGTVLFTIP